MRDFSQNMISEDCSVKEALEKLNGMGEALILFVINQSGQLIGTITDGDIRRGLIEGKNIDSGLKPFIFVNFRYLTKGSFTFQEVIELKKQQITLIPILDTEKIIVKVIDLNKKKSVLPIDVVLMAGGKGERLKPLTNDTPKPLLVVGDKPILERNIDRLSDFGVNDFFVSVNYLSDKIINYFKTEEHKNIDLSYVLEDKPLGTIGSITLIENFSHSHILVMNSDLLTNINFEDFYIQFLENDADMIVASIPYKVNVPYAVLDVENDRVLSFKEKPTYTYYSNAGIYLMKREIIDFIPRNSFYNATDLMDLLISKNMKLVNYPIHGYWLDIGRHEDYNKAQEDIKHITF